jgi:hypothetical protein
MIERRYVVGEFVVLATLLLGPGGASAQNLSISSTFDTDTAGLPPTTGGSDQPTEIINDGVLVQASANGIATQPLEVADGDCSSTPYYFGGVSYELSSPVTGGVLRIEATVAANQITTGVFFDTSSDPYGGSVARLNFSNLGTIVDYFGVVLANYSANTPFRIRVDVDMNSKTWDCTIDDELNGFEDDPVTSGLAFVTDPVLVTQVGKVYLALFGSHNTFTCTPPRAVAYDDVLITTQIFADGFEAGNTDAWSSTTGLSQASVSWYNDGSCSSVAYTGGPYAANQCAHMPGESIYVKFDCTSGSSNWYWDDQCTSLRAAGCNSDLCCEVPFQTTTLDSLVWTCP